MLGAVCCLGEEAAPPPSCRLDLEGRLCPPPRVWTTPPCSLPFPLEERPVATELAATELSSPPHTSHRLAPPPPPSARSVPRQVESDEHDAFLRPVRFGPPRDPAHWTSLELRQPPLPAPAAEPAPAPAPHGGGSGRRLEAGGSEGARAGLWDSGEEIWVLLDAHAFLAPAREHARDGGAGHGGAGGSERGGREGPLSAFPEDLEEGDDVGGGREGAAGAEEETLPGAEGGGGAAKGSTTAGGGGGAGGRGAAGQRGAAAGGAAGGHGGGDGAAGDADGGGAGGEWRGARAWRGTQWQRPTDAGQPGRCLWVDSDGRRKSGVGQKLWGGPLGQGLGLGGIVEWKEAAGEVS